MSGMEGQTTARCAWVDLSKPDYVAYHDEEWGVPQLDDNKLLEALCLEGAQAGLSWYTILKKREGYREAFSQFNLVAAASYSESDISLLLSDSRIVRHEGKIRSVVSNAKAGLRCVSELGSFKAFIWSTWACWWYRGRRWRQWAPDQGGTGSCGAWAWARRTAPWESSCKCSLQIPS